MSDSSSKPEPSEDWFKQHGYIVLLAAQLVYLSSFPLVYELGGLIHPVLGSVILTTAFWGLLLTTASMANNDCRDPRMKWLIWVLAGVSITAETAYLLTSMPAFEYFALVTWTILLIVTSAMILQQIFRTDRVTFNTVCACVTVYCMCGIIWAQFYTIVELFRPASFSVPIGPESESRAGDLYQASITTMYYSFVTLTTLGYGDIIPVKPLARTLTVAEALIGQLYLVVMVARFVGLYTTDSKQARRG